MDGKSWMTVMESFLKDFDKSEWVRVAVSYIENQILKHFSNLESFLKDHENGFQQFKTAFLRLVVPQAALTQSISIESIWTISLRRDSLKEVARTKMHKMRAFKPDEFFGIQSLFDYLDCKNNGFDKNSSTVAMYTKNNPFTSETD
ncbi:hypothetical protein BpHYR1_054439 [Brachionus plicatilis]|uniref:Uncharacterized protein n=1 Tax=Brachionus plicatilis TaxID=10195 RepID=A0A3M7Q0P0_BRAPC|nr:hypothetical protein BpHYR1_054439 [Brachionus plicatilis]